MQEVVVATGMPSELSVADVLAQVDKIKELMKAVMIKDEHYGTIPGTPKPTLLQPGAQKLCLTFRFDPQFASHETYDGKHVTIKSTCTLWHIPSGLRMGSGEGCCSTKEEKYAYRYAARLCPKCGKDAIIKSKVEWGGGWVCFKKKDGCGIKFADGDQAIEGQLIGKVPNEQLADQYNTILKMANKRALVAAVLNVTAASDLFTQDLEDKDNDEEKTRGEGVGSREAIATPTRNQQASDASLKGGDAAITDAKWQAFYMDMNSDPELATILKQVKTEFGIGDLKALKPQDQRRDVMRACQEKMK